MLDVHHNFVLYEKPFYFALVTIIIEIMQIKYYFLLFMTYVKILI